MIKAENVVKIFPGSFRCGPGGGRGVNRGGQGRSGGGHRSFWVWKINFLRCINGLETSTEGHIIIDGVDLADKKTNIKRFGPKSAWCFSSSISFPI